MDEAYDHVCKECHIVRTYFAQIQVYDLLTHPRQGGASDHEFANMYAYKHACVCMCGRKYHEDATDYFRIAIVCVCFFLNFGKRHRERHRGFRIPGQLDLPALWISASCRHQSEATNPAQAHMPTLRLFLLAEDGQYPSVVSDSFHARCLLPNRKTSPKIFSVYT
jgi:hypothetical protein